MLTQRFPGNEPLLYERYGKIAAEMTPRGLYSKQWTEFLGQERYLEPSEERHQDGE